MRGKKVFLVAMLCVLIITSVIFLASCDDTIEEYISRTQLSGTRRITVTVGERYLYYPTVSNCEVDVRRDKTVSTPLSDYAVGTPRYAEDIDYVSYTARKVDDKYIYVEMEKGNDAVTDLSAYGCTWDWNGTKVYWSHETSPMSDAFYESNPHLEKGEYSSDTLKYEFVKDGMKYTVKTYFSSYKGNNSDYFHTLIKDTISEFKTGSEILRGLEQ